MLDGNYWWICRRSYPSKNIPVFQPFHYLHLSTRKPCYGFCAYLLGSKPHWTQWDLLLNKQLVAVKTTGFFTKHISVLSVHGSFLHLFLFLVPCIILALTWFCSFKITALNIKYWKYLFKLAINSIYIYLHVSLEVKGFSLGELSLGLHCHPLNLEVKSHWTQWGRLLNRKI